MASDQAMMELMALLRPTFHSVYRAVDRNLEGTGVTAPMRGVLERLLDAKPRTVPELARVLKIPRQFALKLTTELRRKGLVIRHANPTHKRSDLVSLTDAGRLLTSRILATERAAIAPLAGYVTEAEVATAIRVLRMVGSHFDAAAGPSDEQN